MSATAPLAAVSLPEPGFTHVATPSQEAAELFEAAAEALTTSQVPTAPLSIAVAPQAATSLATPAPVGSPFVLWSILGSAAILVGGLAIEMWPSDKTPSAEQSARIATAAVSSLPAKAEPLEDNPPANVQDIAPAGESYVVAKPTTNDMPAAPVDAETLPELPGNDVAGSNPPNEGELETTEAPSLADAPTNSPPATAIGREGKPAPVLKFDPLDFDPSQLSLGTTVGSPKNPPTSSVADDTTGEAASAAGSSDANESDVLPAPPATPSITVRLGPMPSDAAHPHNVAKQLSLEVESFESADMPLVRFIETLSDLSGVPIALDPVALELAGSSPRGKVTVASRSVTVEKLLQDTLRANRLNFLERDRHVIVALPDADRRSSREFEFNDLMETGAAEAVAIARLIEEFVSPQSWSAAGGPGTIEAKGSTLRVEQSKAVHHEMLLFCERLRMARGLPRKSRYPAELLSIDSPYLTLHDKLTQKTTFTFLPWAPLADVLRHWQESSGITMLADWHRMADLELGPSAPLACSAIDRTWEEVLNEILEPLDLAWWAVDGTTIQITSREALDAIHRVEFYAIPKSVRDQFANGDALLESLRAELRAETGDKAAANDQLQMQLDKPSRRLIVRGTPPMHRYLSKRLNSALTP